MRIASGVGSSCFPRQDCRKTLAVVRFADIILTMTRSHRDAIISSFPDAATRTHIISKNRGDVSDPIGGPPELYHRCAEQIDEYLEGWMDELDFEEEK